MRTLAIALAGIVVLLYGLAVAALRWLEGRLIYPLERLREVTPNPDAERLALVPIGTVDGIELTCRYQASTRADGMTVVLFHGNGEDLSQRVHIAHDLVAEGYGVFLAEYRGYGGNAGHPSEAGLYADGRAALAFVAARTSRIVLHGYSLGSGVAVQLATEYPISALALEAPFTCIADVARTRFPFLPMRWLVRDRYDNLAKIGHVEAPVLIYGGSRDRVVPPQHFARLFDAVRASRRLIVIEGADHIDVWAKGGDALMLAFLRELSRSA
ncbi:alpha/beta hydrolase [Trinickia fusca]|uniref:Alpha/beta fold hydrolase n=1 Tax=Trinickia fusca TaxID=2419777 RepID=A0A494XWZ8_9BURK|nr:alpha/beta fold hydrolase [Trinickia fusca]RKP52634.1 alpha/beta fold hydrolase [Trinickia fusca]